MDLSSFGVYQFQSIQISDLFLSGIEEGIQAIVGRSDSASRIDPRSDDISYMIGIYGSFDLQKVQKSFQRLRQVFTGVQKFQSVFDDDPILAY